MNWILNTSLHRLLHIKRCGKYVGFNRSEKHFGSSSVKCSLVKIIGVKNIYHWWGVSELNNVGSHNRIGLVYILSIFIHILTAYDYTIDNAL